MTKKDAQRVLNLVSADKSLQLGSEWSWYSEIRNGDEIRKRNEKEKKKGVKKKKKREKYQHVK